MFVSCKKFQTCKMTFNFKGEVQKHTFEQNSFRVKLKYHYTKRSIEASPQFFLKGSQMLEYPKNQRNPKSLFKTHSKSYLEILIKR